MGNNSGNKVTYTAADALNDALIHAGVDCVFLNSGTDYPPIIESWAKYKAEGRKIPRVIISPHETVALSAAQGYAQLTGEAQAVFVHVDVGTQTIGGTIHNAFRNRMPVFVFAGLSPHTMENELKGGRNAHIQFIQNVEDQAGIVREYTKLNYEFRSGKNIQQMTYRAMQIAQSEPKGPVYLMATREVLEEEGVNIGADIALWSPVAPLGLDEESVSTVIEALAKAENPLIITSYSGRNQKCVAELEKLAAGLAIPVVEPYQTFMNFPGDNPLHVGYDARGFIEHADLALIIDCDIPWIPALTTPKKGCRVFYIDADPIKDDIPLWYIKAERFMRADAYTAITQLCGEIERNPLLFNRELIESRREKVHSIHKQLREDWNKAGMGQNHITAEFLTKCIREVITDDTVILNEDITDCPTISKLLPRNKPGTMFASGGSSLGWHGGAAIGMKLAHPEKDIVALTGDGTYIFSCPTAVYWMAARYESPFMTVIYNNKGWNAPKQITSKQHPDGYAVKTDSFWTDIDNPAPRLDLVAEAAGGAYAKTVTDPGELRKVLAEGRNAVKNGRSAVINVMIPSAKY